MKRNAVVASVLSIALLAAPLRTARADDATPVATPSAAVADDAVRSDLAIDPEDEVPSQEPLGIERAVASSPALAGSLPAPDILALTSNVLALRPGAHASSTSLGLSKAHLADIRMSRGAKTAIIVTAIVVGVLIIAGVVVLGKPHRHL